LLKKEKKKRRGIFWGKCVFSSSSSVNFTNFAKILEIFDIKKLKKKKKKKTPFEFFKLKIWPVFWVLS
jgi:hypothetical protein